MNTKKISKPLLFITYILLVISAGLCISSCILNGFSSLLVIITELLSVIAAILYFAKGYSKDANRYFRAVMFFAALCYLIDYIGLVIFPISETTNSLFYLKTILVLIVYGNLMILAFGKDLEKKWTYLILSINTVIYVYIMIASICAFTASLSLNLDLPYMLISVEWVIISAVSLIMAKAKYLDKENRGSK